MFAVALALLAAIAGAGAAVFQSRGARSVSPPPANAARLLLVLLQKPIWLFGAALAGVSGLFHTIALGRGSLIEVESIMVTSLLFALALGIVVTGSRVSVRDWFGAIATIVGLVAFLLFADPQDGDYTIPVRVAIIGTIVFIAVMSALVASAARATQPNVRAVLFGSAAAVALGSAAVMLKVIASNLVENTPLRALLPAFAFLGLCELSALLLQQVAFRQGSLAAALAPFVGGNPLVAGGVGIIVFGERFHHSVGDLLGASAGIVLVIIGIFILASSPLVAAGSGESTDSNTA
ncbi:MAG: DMT family transporter [Acidimicrobiales bacterium]